MTLIKVDRCFGGCGVRQELLRWLRWFLRTGKVIGPTFELAYCILPQRTTPAAPKAALSPMVLTRSLWKKSTNPHMSKINILKSKSKKAVGYGHHFHFFPQRQHRSCGIFFTIKSPFSLESSSVSLQSFAWVLTKQWNLYSLFTRAPPTKPVESEFNDLFYPLVFEWLPRYQPT